MQTDGTKTVSVSPSQASATIRKSQATDLTPCWSDQREAATKDPCFAILLTFQLRLMGAATVSAASYDVETIRAPTFRPGP
jgi:hypothetical protein